MELLMEITKEIELDAPADEVWRLLSDDDELAGWVGDEVRAADIARHDDAADWCGRGPRTASRPVSRSSWWSRANSS